MLFYVSYCRHCGKCSGGWSTNSEDAPEVVTEMIRAGFRVEREDSATITGCSPDCPEDQRRDREEEHLGRELKRLGLEAADG